MNEINSIELLLHLYDAQYNRYNSFKEKININLALSSGIVAILSIVLPSIIGNVFNFVKLKTNSNIWNIYHLLFLIFFFGLAVLYFSLYFYILFQSSIALTPIKVNLIDYESIDLQTNGKSDEAYTTAVNDLKYTINANKNIVNQLYEKLIRLQDSFLFFIALTIIIIFAITFMCVF